MNSNYQALRQFFKIFSLFAITPQLKYYDVRPDQIKVNKCQYFTTGLVIIFMNIEFINKLSPFHTYQLFTIQFILMCLVFIMLEITLNVNLIIFLTMYKDHVQFVTDFFAMVQLIERHTIFKLRIKIKSFKIIFYLTICVLTLFYVFLILVTIFGMRTYVIQELPKQLLDTCFFTILVIVNYFNIFYFVLIVYVINSCLATLKETFSEILVSAVYDDQFRRNINLVGHVQNLIFHLIDKFNLIFGLNICLIILNDIFMIVIHFYSIFLIIERSGEHHMAPVAILLSSIVFLIFYIRLFAVIIIFNNINTQLVHYKNILIKTNYESHDKFKFVIDMLTFKILHVDVKITAFDLFPINLKLVTNLFAGAVMYLMVVLQFRVME